MEEGACGWVEEGACGYACGWRYRVVVRVAVSVTVRGDGRGAVRLSLGRLALAGGQIGSLGSAGLLAGAADRWAHQVSGHDRSAGRMAYTGFTL